MAITLPSPASERRQGWRVAIVAGLASWVVLAWTAPRMPMVWDEGDYLFRADLIVAWFRLLFDVGNPHGGLHAFASAAIFEHWQFTQKMSRAVGRRTVRSVCGRRRPVCNAPGMGSWFVSDSPRAP